MCILITEPYHASRLFEIVQQLLLEDIRLTNSVLSLQKKLAEGSSANNIAAFVSDVLENPVLLLSADGTPLASKRLSSEDSALITACRPNAFLMRLQNSPFMLLEPGDGLDPLPRRCCICVSVRNRQIYFCSPQSRKTALQIRMLPPGWPPCTKHSSAFPESRSTFVRSCSCRTCCSGCCKTSLPMKRISKSS